MNLRSLYILFIFSFITSCKKEVASDSNEVSTSELVYALDAFVFTVELPKGISEDQMAGLARKYPDGSIKPMASRNGYKGGEKIKYICFHPKNGVFRYSSFIDGEVSGGGASSNFPKNLVGGHGFPGGSKDLYNCGEPIVRYSIDDSMSFSGEGSMGDPVEDDFDIIFHIQPKE